YVHRRDAVLLVSPRRQGQRTPSVGDCRALTACPGACAYVMRCLAQVRWVPTPQPPPVARVSMANDVAHAKYRALRGTSRTSICVAGSLGGRSESSWKGFALLDEPSARPLYFEGALGVILGPTNLFRDSLDARRLLDE